LIGSLALSISLSWGEQLSSLYAAVQIGEEKSRMLIISTGCSIFFLSYGRNNNLVVVVVGRCLLFLAFSLFAASVLAAARALLVLANGGSGGCRSL